MSCVTYNCDELPGYILNECDDVLDGFSQIMLLECGHGITDFTNPTQYNAALSAGKAKIMPAVKAGLDLPSALSVEANVSGETPNNVNYDRTATVIDGNVSLNNDNFYDVVHGGHKFGGFVLFSNSDEDNPRIEVVNAVVKASGGKVAGNTGGDTTRYETTLAWRSKKGPKTYPAPAGIFD